MQTRKFAPHLLILFIFFAVQASFAQEKSLSLEKEKFHWNREIENGIGYTQAVKVGNTLYISGITSGGEGDIQIKNVYKGLQEVLQNYGLSFGHVVKENLYSTDLEALKPHLELRKDFYRGDYPAATWVEVKALFDPGASLEVELIVIFP